MIYVQDFTVPNPTHTLYVLVKKVYHIIRPNGHLELVLVTDTESYKTLPISDRSHDIVINEPIIKEGDVFIVFYDQTNSPHQEFWKLNLRPPQPTKQIDLTKPPVTCPVCNSHIGIFGGETYCFNMCCPSVMLNHIVKFFSIAKQVILSEPEQFIIKRLLQTSSVKRLTDLFNLTEDSILHSFYGETKLPIDIKVLINKMNSSKNFKSIIHLIKSFDIGIPQWYCDYNNIENDFKDFTAFYNWIINCNDNDVVAIRKYMSQETYHFIKIYLSNYYNNNQYLELSNYGYI